jgi:hypothetical protein
MHSRRELATTLELSERGWHVFEAIEGWAEPRPTKLSRSEPRSCGGTRTFYRPEIWYSSPGIKPPGGAYTPPPEQLEVALEGHLEKNARDPREVAEVIAAKVRSGHGFDIPWAFFFARVGHCMRGKIVPPQYKVTRGYLGLNRVKQYVEFHGLSR